MGLQPGGGDYEYIIHIHLMGHTLRPGEHAHIEIQPLYHISGGAVKSDIPIDALVLSCTVIRFPGSPQCVASSFIFM